MVGYEAAAAAATKSSGSSTFLLLIVVFIAAIYFMAIRPGRNRQKKVQQQQNTVRPGARVRTTAGMYATVVAVDGDDVVLEVAPDVEVRYMKRAIMEVLSPGDEPAEDMTDEPEGAEGAEAAEGEYGEGGWPEHPESEDAAHTGDVAGATAAHETVAQEDGEHETEPDLSAPTGTYGDDLIINGQRDASGNGHSNTATTPENSASQE